MNAKYNFLTVGLVIAIAGIVVGDGTAYAGNVEEGPSEVRDVLRNPQWEVLLAGRFRDPDADFEAMASDPLAMGGQATAITAQASAPFILESDAAYTMAFRDQHFGAVAAGPGEYFAVWVDYRTRGNGDLYGQRILPDGTVAARGSIELLRDWDRTINGIPAVAWNGAIYLVAWFEGSDLYGMRVAPDGQVLDLGGFFIGTNTGSTSFRWPAIASDGEDFLVVRATGDSVVAQRVGGDGTVLDPAPIVLSSGATGLGFPKLAFGAGVYMVAWSQSPAQAIRAARVTPEGDVLDPGGINVSGGGTDVDAHVDFDGQDFYVVWQRQDGSFWDLWGAHVSPQAQVVTAPRLLLDGNSWGFVSSGQVAFNGTNHLITITTDEPVFSNSDLYALMVDGVGAPIGVPFPVSTLSGRSQTAFGVDSVGDQFFILWEANYIGGVSFVYDTEGARVDAGGNVLDRPDPIAVSTCASWQIASAASFDGENFLSVFEDWREGKPDYQAALYAVRVTPQGHVLDTSAIRVAEGFGRPQQQPDATYGGGQHVVVYMNENASHVNEVRMVRVLPDGTVLDPNGILIFANQPTGDTFLPKVAWNGQKYCVIWYDSLPAPGEELMQFALVGVNGTIEFGPANVPDSEGVDFDGFELTSNGSEFLIAWVDFDRIKTTRISNSGAVLGTQTVWIFGDWIAESPAVAFNGQSYMIAWGQWGDGGVRVDAHRVDQSGAPVGNLITVVEPNQHAFPMGVFALGTDFAVIGRYRVGDQFVMSSARYDASGIPIGDPQILTTASQNETGAPTSGAMSPDGSLFTVNSLWAGNPYNTFRAQGILFNLGVPVPGDFDGDGDVDIVDSSQFASCFTGADGGPVDPGCEVGDLDADGDIDCDDWDLFVLAWTDPGSPPSLVECADPIPTVSEWGLVAMTLLMLAAGTLVLRERKLGERTA